MGILDRKLSFNEAAGNVVGAGDLQQIAGTVLDPFDQGDLMGHRGVVQRQDQACNGYMGFSIGKTGRFQDTDRRIFDPEGFRSVLGHIFTAAHGDGENVAVVAAHIGLIISHYDRYLVIDNFFKRQGKDSFYC